MNLTALIVIVYALLVIVGGVLGFVKAGSKVSLIFATCYGLILLLVGYSLYYKEAGGPQLAMILIAVMLVFFSIRYARSSPRAFMPGGLMAILSLLALAGVWLTAHRY